MIEAAEYLGLIQTEAQDPQSRAYRLAHQGLSLMKTELIGSPLEILDEHTVKKDNLDSGSVLIESLEGVVSRVIEQERETIIDLGPGGGVSFVLYGEGVEAKIHARTEDGGAHDLNLILPPYRPTPHGRILFTRTNLPGDSWSDEAARRKEKPPP